MRRPMKHRALRLAVVASFAALLAAACDPAARMASAPLFHENDGHESGGTSAAASNFTVLANAAVTCTDGTITGDVGTYLTSPPGAVTLTNCPVTGTVHVGDGVAKQAFNNFLSTYAALAQTPCDAVLTGTLDGAILPPGTYCFDAAAALTGTLTLDGPSNGTWLFKIGTAGTGALTASSFTVVMAGGGQPCNVTWWVSQAATTTDSDFLGTILAGAAITLTRGTFGGNVWAGASGVGDVTITGTAVTGCEGVKGPGRDHDKCNQGVGNGPEGCDPGNSNHRHPSNDEDGGTPGNPGRKGGN